MTGSEFPDGGAPSAHDAIRTLADAKAILLDWDGCASVANQPYGATIAFLAHFGDRVAIVSNNSTLLPDDIVGVLARAGIGFPADRVILAGYEAIATAARKPGARTLVLGPPRMRALANRMGLNLSRKNADLVVLLRDTRFSYARLDRAVDALRLGARLIVANPDKTHPGPNGAVVPETGALLAALAACIDLAALDVEIVGKPSAVLFERACVALGVSTGEAVMIGDNPLTDIVGAAAVGMPSILVEPGSRLGLGDLLPPAFRIGTR